MTGYPDTSQLEKIAERKISKRKYEEAYEILFPLSDQGSVYALLMCGWLHECALIDKANIDNAISFYERAANIGDSTGLYMLGCLYYNRHEYENALIAFEKGEYLDHSGCTRNLGLMFYRGIGTNVDLYRGYYLLTKSSKMGNLRAKLNLINIDVKIKLHTENYSNKDYILLFDLVLIKLKYFIIYVRDIGDERIM